MFTVVTAVMILIAMATTGQHLSSTNWVPEPVLPNPHQKKKKSPGYEDITVRQLRLERGGTLLVVTQLEGDSTQVCVPTSHILATPVYCR